jgi:hypothetical protein
MWSSSLILCRDDDDDDSVPVKERKGRDRSFSSVTNCFTAVPAFWWSSREDVLWDQSLSSHKQSVFTSRRQTLYLLTSYLSSSLVRRLNECSCTRWATVNIFGYNNRNHCISFFTSFFLSLITRRHPFSSLTSKIIQERRSSRREIIWSVTCFFSLCLLKINEEESEKSFLQKESLLPSRPEKI